MVGELTHKMFDEIEHYPLSYFGRLSANNTLFKIFFKIFKGLRRSRENNSHAENPCNATLPEAEVAKWN